MKWIKSSAVVVALFFLFVAPAGAQEEGVALGNVEYLEAWYTRLAPAEDDEELDLEAYSAMDYQEKDGLVVRQRITNTEYMRRKQDQITNRWVPLHEAILNGQFELASEFGVSADKAAQMVQLDENTRRRLDDSPTYREDLINQMAEWAFYYNQYELWVEYVEDKVLRRDLPKSEKPDYNPRELEAELQEFLELYQNRAKELQQATGRIYSNPEAWPPGVVQRVKRNTQEREAYEQWLQEREDLMVQFVELWGRKYNGSEFWIDDVQYLVRNLADRPDRPEEDDLRYSLAPNAVLLEVPKKKLVTPYDIIHKDGQLKNPETVARAPEENFLAD